MTGPSTGPIRGPIPNIAIAAPLFSCLTKSEIVPPPLARGALPVAPAKNRKVINIPKLLLAPHAMVKIRNRIFVT